MVVWELTGIALAGSFEPAVNGAAVDELSLSCALEGAALVEGAPLTIAPETVGAGEGVTVSRSANVTATCTSTAEGAVGTSSAQTTVHLAPATPTYSLSATSSGVTWSVTADGAAACALVDGETAVVSGELDLLVEATSAPTTKTTVSVRCDDGAGGPGATSATSETLLKQDITLGTKPAASDVSILFGNYDLNGEAGTGHSEPTLKIVVGNFKLSADASNATIVSTDYTRLSDVIGAFEVSGNANYFALTTTGEAGGTPAFNALARVGGSFTLQNNTNLNTAQFPGLSVVGAGLTVLGNNALLLCDAIERFVCPLTPDPLPTVMLSGGTTCQCPVN